MDLTSSSSGHDQAEDPLKIHHLGILVLDSTFRNMWVFISRIDCEFVIQIQRKKSIMRAEHLRCSGK